MKRHEDYNTFSKTLDPLALWEAISTKHTIPIATGSKAVLKQSAFSEYANVRQGEFESLADFRVRFDLKYKSYVDNGNKAKDEEDIAMDFLEALDKGRYVEFVVKFLNNIAKNLILEPSNVNEVYNLASTRLKADRQTRGNRVHASYATIRTPRKRQQRND